MKNWHKAIIAVLALFAVFKVGYSQGLRDCPSFAAHEARMDEAAVRDVVALLQVPSSRDQTCDQIFDLVTGDLHEGERLEQADRAARPDPVGE